MRKFCKPRLTGGRARFPLIAAGRWRVELFHWHSVPASTELVRYGGGGFDLTIKLLPYLDLSINRTAR